MGRWSWWRFHDALHPMVGDEGPGNAGTPGIQIEPTFEGGRINLKRAFLSFGGTLATDLFQNVFMYSIKACLSASASVEPKVCPWSWTKSGALSNSRNSGFMMPDPVI